MLAVSELDFSRGDQQHHYQLRLNRGETLLIKGQSGLGKTTLLDLIAGFLSPNTGEIRFNEQILNDLAVEARPVSYLFQSHNLFEHLTIAENLQLALKHCDWSQVLVAVHALGLTGQLLKKPGKLSGGQQQRIGLIRAVLRPEPILLLDEPFSSLDNQTRHLAKDWLREQLQQRPRITILVSHDTEDADLAQQVLDLGAL